MLKPPTILAIDDDPTTLSVLATMLGKEGFRVLQALSGPRGRELARSDRPDLILLDQIMPGEDGLETCRRLKADADTSSIPIIFVSIDHDVDVKVAALERDAVDYITKPYAPAEVLARVRLHLRMRQAQRALVEAQTEKLRHLAQAQQAMLVLPQDAPAAGFGVCRKPRHEVGGDFYDVVPISEYIWDYVVADVAGHDLESSLATAALKALVRQNASAFCYPSETVRTLNAVMHRVYPEGPYVTLAYARLNRARNIVTLVLAGHPPLIRLRPDGSAEVFADSSELIGAFDSISVQGQDIPVARGDRLFLFTDGLIEKGDAADRARGLDRLVALCRQFQAEPIAAAAAGIVAAIAPASGPADDDLLLLAIEV